MDLGIDGVTDAVLVGAGGAAQVYRATQSALDRTVAIKVLTSVDDGQRRRFERESKALGRMSEHRGIVTVYEAGVTHRGLPYLVMQYCSGGSLRERIDQLGPIPWRDAAAHMKEVAGTIADAHDLGIVHRDLKPANILVSANGATLVADFGIAAILDAAGGATQSLTFTPAYAPPEAFHGSEPSTPGDVYSIAASLLAAVSGQAPFVSGGEDPSIAVVMSRIVHDGIDAHRPAGVPDALWADIRAAMDADPTTRPTAREFADRLQRLLAHRPPEQPEPPRTGGGAELAPLAPVTGDSTPTLDADEPAPPHAGDVEGFENDPHDVTAPLAPEVPSFPRQAFLTTGADTDDVHDALITPGADQAGIGPGLVAAIVVALVVIVIGILLVL